jgi:SAM-dependent methyltransferase
LPSKSEILLAPVSRNGRIIEIGPSFNPIAPKADGWDVRSVDHLSREGLVAKYTGHPGVDVGRIEPVDFVWGGGPLSDAVPTALHGTFDAFVASHVIEHTPDLIAFLNSAATLLNHNGIVVLAIPDKRYCFDYFQPLTTTGQVIEAHAEQRSRHSRRLLFDHVAYAVSNGGSGAWGQHPSNGLRFMHPIEQALDLFGTKDDGYIDAHAWRFSPASFQLLILELARLGRTDWQIERVTEAVGCEFFAWLRRGGMDTAAALPAEAFAARRMTLLKRTLVEARAQIDWLLAGEPALVTVPLGLLPAKAAAPATPTPPAAEAEPSKPCYVDWFPGKDNAGRAFEGEWSSAVPGLSTTGNVPLFDDSRIVMFEERLGGFAGKRVLELGPLEGGHTYMMTRRGATVTAIESNMRAWMRCLVAKDAVGMEGATFLLGDFVQYLAGSPPRVDFALASGVLYHMTDPATLLQNLCLVSDAVGLWTHYFDVVPLREHDQGNKFDFKPREVVTLRGRVVEYYSQKYLQALDWKGACGGSATGSNWLRKQDIIGIMEDEGFACESFLDHPDHPNGPAFCVFGQRK